LVSLLNGSSEMMIEDGGSAVGAILSNASCREK
jgi:hypothetical protein